MKIDSEKRIIKNHSTFLFSSTKNAKRVDQDEKRKKNRNIQKKKHFAGGRRGPGSKKICVGGYWAPTQRSYALLSSREMTQII